VRAVGSPHLPVYPAAAHPARPRSISAGALRGQRKPSFSRGALRAHGTTWASRRGAQKRQARARSASSKTACPTAFSQKAPVPVTQPYGQNRTATLRESFSCPDERASGPASADARNGRGPGVGGRAVRASFPRPRRPCRGARLPVVQAASRPPRAMVLHFERRRGSTTRQLRRSAECWPTSARWWPARPP
jgi:hypothetical protein